MNSIDTQYQILLQSILDYGVEKSDRTGTGTKSIFGYTIRHKMSDGFPLLTTKKMPWKTIVTELLWFLKGDTNIKYLVENNCHIWDGDAYKRYVNSPEVKIPYSKEDFINKIKTDKEWEDKWGELGPIYGKQWRSWEVDTSYLGDDEWTAGKDIDQIANLINDLKTNPDSRRLMVSAWNVGELDQMVLPPCHYGFQVYTRELSYEEKKLYTYKHFSNQPQFDLDAFEKFNIPSRAISLMWNQRSCDLFLGIPFNIASYALLLTIIAKEVNMIPEELIGNLGDTHLYLNHIEQAKEQIERESYELPTLKHLKDDSFYKSLSEDQSLYAHLENTDFILENYTCHPTIKAPLSN
jgi:thymidylate synthase